jgi:hypothetical protein
MLVDGYTVWKEEMVEKEEKATTSFKAGTRTCCAGAP